MTTNNEYTLLLRLWALLLWHNYVSNNLNEADVALKSGIVFILAIRHDNTNAVMILFPRTKSCIKLNSQAFPYLCSP